MKIDYEDSFDVTCRDSTLMAMTNEGISLHTVNDISRAKPQNKIFIENCFKRSPVMVLLS